MAGRKKKTRNELSKIELLDPRSKEKNQCSCRGQDKLLKYILEDIFGSSIF
ncbi:MAG: hypothetical protein ACXACP_14300 [Candidatus Hodarchaeales archaeon]|jgi:hypothetical protein